MPQSVAYLDPLMRVGEQVRGVYGTRGQQKKAFARYGLDQSVEQKFPFQLSGGMTRRVAGLNSRYQRGQADHLPTSLRPA